MGRSVRIDGWPFGGQLARLHWVGPLVEQQPPALLAEFVPYSGFSRRREALLNMRNYSWEQRWVAMLPVGYLPKLIIGSLWVAGMAEQYPEYEVLSIDVNIKFARCLLMAPRDRTARGNVVVPRSVYPISTEIAQSSVFVIPTRSIIRAVVIPCIEILGCYYAPSSKLAEAVLDGSFVTDRARYIGLQSRYDAEARRGHLLLGKYVDDDDCVEVARMWAGTIAASETKALLLRGAAGRMGKHYPVVIRPPFEGPTRLTVQGMRYLIGGHQAFLVFKILECTAPVPWLFMTYNRVNPGKQGRSLSLTRGRSWNGSYRRNSENQDGRSLTISSSPPRAHDLPTRVSGSRDRNRYATDLRLYFAPRGPIETTGASVYDSDTTAFEPFGIGRGSSGSRLRAAAFSGTSRDIPTKLSAFRSAMYALSSVDSSITLLDEDIYDFAPPWDGESPRPRPWAYFDHYDAQDPRRAAVARIRLNDTPFVLIDTENRPIKARSPFSVDDDEREEMLAMAILRSPEDIAVDDLEIRAILKNLIITRGILSGKAFGRTVYASWRHAKVIHIADEPAQRYASRISLAIRGPAQQFE